MIMILALKNLPFRGSEYLNKNYDTKEQTTL